ncbi:MAG: NAD(P)H-binding protein [Bacteroidota bacterium]
MKILVIGASGMLAGPVIRKLDEAGYALRLFSRSVKPSMFINEYEIVQGDLFNPADLDRAVRGCDAIHITISNTDDVLATEAILETAKENHIQRISMVSGCTVAEENRWFGFTDKKFRAEQLIMQSGIPYYIFRPTWFFESLEMLVRNGKATILGKQPGLYHWVAGDDLGRMVANAYGMEGTENSIYYVYGPESYPMKELLEMYCREIHPGIEKVTEAPIPVLKLVALLTRNSQLRFAASLFSYFQKVREPEIPEEELGRLGKAEIDFKTWIESRKPG